MEYDAFCSQVCSSASQTAKELEKGLEKPENALENRRSNPKGKKIERERDHSQGLFFYISPHVLSVALHEALRLNVIAYHPDSDWGPVDEDHPMFLLLRQGSKYVVVFDVLYLCCYFFLF